MNPQNHPRPVVGRSEWLAAREQHLLKEKELTHLRDRLRAERRALPWVRVEKNYVFDTREGRRTLAELFDGRSQLFVKHFMFGPGWKEGCVGCSFETDHIESTLVHLEHHDVSVVAVARAPLAEIEAFRQRMGWRLKWVSSFGGDFNYDFHVSFTPAQIASGAVYYNYAMSPIPIPIPMEELSGLSAFYKDESGEMFHTHSAYGRGMEELLGTYMVLDMMPLGRNDGPNGNLTGWVRHHDRYGAGGFVDSTGRYRAPTNADACCNNRSAT